MMKYLKLLLIFAALSTILSAAPFVHDTFTDSDGTLLNAHVGETGATWTWSSGDGGTNNAQISSNAVFFAAAGGYGSYYASGSASSSDYDVWGTLHIQTLDGGSHLKVRVNGTGGDYYYLLLDSSGYVINKLISGSGALVASQSASLATNRDYAVHASFVGTSIKLYVDGELVISTTDSSLSGSGHPNIGIGFSGGTAPASLTVGQRWTEIYAGGTHNPGTTSGSGTGLSTATVSSTAAVGDSGTYSVQYQRAPDSSGSPGAWADVGSAQTGITLGVAPSNLSDTGLSGSTTYWYRVKVTYSLDSSFLYSVAGSVTTGGASLSGGTISLSSQTYSTATMTGTGASGGTGPYTYQWYKSSSSGFTPGGGTLIAGATSQNLTDTGLASSTTKYYVRRAADSASATADSNQLTVSTNGVILPNDAALTYSPYNWVVTSGSAISNETGSYIRTSFTGTSCLLLMDNAALGTNPTMPVLSYTVDDSPFQSVTLATATNSISLASGLSSGTHTLRIWVESVDNANADRWTVPSSRVKIVGFQLDNGASGASVSTRSKRAIIYGDSIVEINGKQSWAQLVGEALGAEFGEIGHSYQGWRQGTPGNIPNFFTPGDDTNSSWNKYYSGTSRLSAGLFSPSPDYIIVNLGENDLQFSSSDASVTASVSGWISSARAAAPAARIYVVLPFAGAKASAISTGFSNYQSSAPTDTKVYLINAGPDIGLYTSPGSAVAYSADRLHPNALGAARIGAIVTKLITATESAGAHAYAF